MSRFGYIVSFVCCALVLGASVFTVCAEFPDAMIEPKWYATGVAFIFVGSLCCRMCFAGSDVPDADSWVDCVLWPFFSGEFRQCSWTGIVPGHKSADRDEVAYGCSAFKEIGGDGM